MPSHINRVLARGRSALWPAAISALAMTGSADAQSKPNIVVFLVDDVGIADTAPYGSEIATPNLQSLANNGVQFTNYYTRCMM